MTIPVLLGAQDTIAPALASIADSIGTMLNPNAKFQHAMKALFAQNPKLMQEFVDVEKANPGTLKAMGFGDEGSDMLTKMQESIPALRNRVLQPAIATELGKMDGDARRSAIMQGASGQTPGQLAEDSFSAWYVKEGQKMLKENPDLFERYVRSRWGLGSELEQKTEELAVQNITNVEQLSGLNVEQMRNKLRTGQIDAGVLSAGMNHPKYGPALRIALAQNTEENRMSMEREMVRARQDGNDPLLRTKYAAANAAYEKSGYAGSLGAWYYTLNNGDTAYGQPTATELAAVEEARKDAKFNLQIGRINRLQTGINNTYNSLMRLKGKQKMSAATAQPYIDGMNRIYQAEGSPWRAKWVEDDPWYSSANNHIVFEGILPGGDGKKVIATTPDATFNELMPPVGAVDSKEFWFEQMDPQVRSMVANMDTMTVERRDSIVTAIKDPTIKQQVEAYFDIVEKEAK